MDDNCVLDFIYQRLTCSMNPETVVTCTCGHFNQVVFAVCMHDINQYIWIDIQHFFWTWEFYGSLIHILGCTINTNLCDL